MDSLGSRQLRKTTIQMDEYIHQILISNKKMITIDLRIDINQKYT